jgi:N-acetylglutamate synthase-like GNAT family acetyltransferase
MNYDLIVVTSPEEWERYHFIRRTELFEARGRFGVYDPKHADEFLPNHFPLLLKLDGQGIATTRLDIRDGDVAIVRLVAVVRSEQGRGHGRVLAARTEAFARDLGVAKLVVNAAANAVGFYQRLGFLPEPWDPSELVGWNADSVQMAKCLRE